MDAATVSVESVVKHFESLPDPRDTRNRRHRLGDVIVIAVCGVIVGCEGPTAIERWAKAKKEWLGQLLELPNGIPSRDCVRRVLSALKPAAFQECFQNGSPTYFDEAILDDLAWTSLHRCETHEKGHGRLDDRAYYLAKLTG